jgi:LPS-assembly protein
VKLNQIEDKTFLSPVHTILLDQFKTICYRSSIFFILFITLLLSSSDLFSQETFKLSVGDEINIMSDKAYRRAGQNLFEAIGNVIITHRDEALYGESAQIEMDTGAMEVLGNVRYVAPGMTLYGSKLNYNAKSKFLSVENARVVSSQYTILGKYISREKPDEVLAYDAEYTTCVDCPESWSIFGKRVKIYAGQYIYIKNAFVKIKGVTVMYLPYIVFPIKKTRQTGFLFPKFSISVSNGISYRQPWYWAISKSSDLTLSPFVQGSRGTGNQFEYRHVFGDRKWMQLDSLQMRDRMYLPEGYNDSVKGYHKGYDNDDVNGTHYLRHFSNYEHHLSFGNNINHHFLYNDARDTDINRDFGQYVNRIARGNAYGLESFIDFRSNIFSISFEGYFKRSLFEKVSTDFDDHFVQILPRVNVDMTPVTLVHSDIPGLQNIAFGSDVVYNFFKQNHYSEGNYIRNAHRISVNPYLDWHLFTIGPFHIKTNIKLDYQHYRFPYEEGKDFKKMGTIFTSELSFEVDKIFGLAYKESVDVDRVSVEDLKRLHKQREKEELERKKSGNNIANLWSETIGELPSYEDSYTDDYIVKTENSYRHGQEFKIKHHYTSDSYYSGNSKFYDQIVGGSGTFDDVDTIRILEHKVGSTASQTQISTRNTVEFVWLNSLVKKSAQEFDLFEDGRYLRQNFSYQKLLYFNISQGLELNTKKEPGKEKTFKDDLTRLHIWTGFNMDKTTSISLDEYYFYYNSSHIFTFNLNKDFGVAKLGTSLSYNSQDKSDKKKTGSISGSIRPLSILAMSFSYSYDLVKKISTGSYLSVGYIPTNRCWKFDIRYDRILKSADRREFEHQYSFNFLVNFANGIFTPLIGSDGNSKGLGGY